MQLLLEHGANPDLRDGSRMSSGRRARMTALERAMERGRYDGAARPLLLPIIKLLRSQAKSEASGWQVNTEAAPEWVFVHTEAAAEAEPEAALP